eukprot:4472677-Alexandrium_andersonii.AAC.1
MAVCGLRQIAALTGLGRIADRTLDMLQCTDASRRAGLFRGLIKRRDFGVLRQQCLHSSRQYQAPMTRSASGRRAPRHVNYSHTLPNSVSACAIQYFQLLGRIIPASERVEHGSLCVGRRSMIGAGNAHTCCDARPLGLDS